MSKRDDRETVRPTATEVDVVMIRRLARNAHIVADQAEAALIEADRIAQRALQKIIPIMRSDAASLEAIAANMEARP